MNETREALEITFGESKFLEENQQRTILIDVKDEKTCKVIQDIRDLDVSIREQELQLKIIRAESLELQLKSCEELKNKLTIKPREIGYLAKNTRKFLDICDFRKSNKSLSDKSCATYKKIRSPKLQIENNPHESMMSITDEEKERLDFLTSETSNSAKEKNFTRTDSIDDLHTLLNPYSIDESANKLLKGLEDKLLSNNNKKSNIV